MLSIVAHELEVCGPRSWVRICFQTREGVKLVMHGWCMYMCYAMVANEPSYATVEGAHAPGCGSHHHPHLCANAARTTVICRPALASGNGHHLYYPLSCRALANPAPPQLPPPPFKFLPPPYYTHAVCVFHIHTLYAYTETTSPSFSTRARDASSAFRATEARRARAIRGEPCASEGAGHSLRTRRDARASVAIAVP